MTFGERVRQPPDEGGLHRLVKEVANEGGGFSGGGLKEKMRAWDLDDFCLGT